MDFLDRSKDMWTAILGALAGAMKGKQDQQAWRDQQNFEATRERYSPWTGMHGQYMQKPNKMGTMLQGFMAGLSYGQKMKQGQEKQPDQNNEYNMDMISGPNDSSLWGYRQNDNPYQYAPQAPAPQQNYYAKR